MQTRYIVPSWCWKVEFFNTNSIQCNEFMLKTLFLNINWIHCIDFVFKIWLSNMNLIQSIEFMFKVFLGGILKTVCNFFYLFWFFCYFSYIFPSSILLHLPFMTIWFKWGNHDSYFCDSFMSKILEFDPRISARHLINNVDMFCLECCAWSKM